MTISYKLSTSFRFIWSICKNSYSDFSKDLHCSSHTTTRSMFPAASKHGVPCVWSYWAMQYICARHIAGNEQFVWNQAATNMHMHVKSVNEKPYYVPETRGALPYKPIRDVPFFRVSFFSINSWTGYENWSEIPKRVMTICSRKKAIVFKNKRLLFSRTKGYCFQEQ